MNTLYSKILRKENSRLPICWH